MAQSNTMVALSPREAVADALHRCVLGLDNNDRYLFESACLKDENVVLIASGVTIQGWNAIKEAFAKVFELVTTHYITNIRVELKYGATTASLASHAIAYHVRPEDRSNRKMLRTLRAACTL
jgi:pyruvate-formate lyase-activating enzyme